VVQIFRKDNLYYLTGATLRPKQPAAPHGSLGTYLEMTLLAAWVVSLRGQASVSNGDCLHCIEGFVKGPCSPVLINRLIKVRTANYKYL
jgi:hypothetical protein